LIYIPTEYWPKKVCDLFIFVYNIRVSIQNERKDDTYNTKMMFLHTKPQPHIILGGTSSNFADPLSITQLYFTARGKRLTSSCTPAYTSADLTEI